jgi:hypothetical protein
VSGDAGSDVVQGGPGDDPCVATTDEVGANDIANGGHGTDVGDVDPGDVEHHIEVDRPCRR